MRTAVGELAIDAVEIVMLGGITEEDRLRAGFSTRADLLDELRGREGNCSDLNWPCVTIDHENPPRTVAEIKRCPP